MLEDSQKLTEEIYKDYRSKAKVWFILSVVAGSLAFLLIFGGMAMWLAGIVHNGLSVSIVGAFTSAVTALFYYQSRYYEKKEKEYFNALQIIYNKQKQYQLIRYSDDPSVIKDFYRSELNLTSKTQGRPAVVSDEAQMQPYDQGYRTTSPTNAAGSEPFSHQRI